MLITYDFSLGDCGHSTLMIILRAHSKSTIAFCANNRQGSCRAMQALMLHMCWTTCPPWKDWDEHVETQSPPAAVSYNNWPWKSVSCLAPPSHWSEQYQLRGLAPVCAMGMAHTLSGTPLPG